MDRIICLAGESGSGKTTLCKKLEQLGYNVIKSYTTRKPRYENEYGHIFVDCVPTILNVHGFNRQDKIKHGIIADTFFDDEYYWALEGQYKNKGTSIYVIDVAGIKELRERVKDAEIVVIYLKVDENTRYKRMVKTRGYESVERIEHDREVFTTVPCDYAVDANRNIEEVLKDVKGIIEMEGKHNE